MSSNKYLNWITQKPLFHALASNTNLALNAIQITVGQDL